MKRHLTLLFITLTLMFTGCTPALQKLADTGFDAVKVCIIDLVQTEDLEAGKGCVINAASGIASTLLQEQLQAYLAGFGGDFLAILDDVLFPKGDFQSLSVSEAPEDTADRLSGEIAGWKTETSFRLEPYLYGVLGMAQAQGETKTLEDIKGLFTPEVVVLLLSLLTIPLTRVIKNVVGTVGYETVLVNAFLKTLGTGITMGLSGGATIGYIIFWIVITFAVDQATYLLAVKPEKK